jgi:hypothetical protein
MKWIPAKLITIITVSEARDRIAEEIKRLGSGFSVGSVAGVGFHGERRDDLFNTANVQVSVVASAQLTEQLMAWVTGELEPLFPVVAWVSDVTALPGRHFA